MNQKPKRNISVYRAMEQVGLDLTKLSDEVLEELYKLIAEELKRRGYIA